MNKPKSNKGITLVALIITVIVLLILTVVAIRAITGEGVLDKAKTATNSYEDKRREEENMLGDYADIIDANMPQNTTPGGENTEDGVKYYYAQAFNVEGVTAPAVVVLTELEGNEKQINIYAKVHDSYISMIQEYEFEMKEYNEDTILEEKVEIKAGTTTIEAIDGNILINGDKLYNLDGDNTTEFKLTSLNDEIRNIIENATAM